MWQVAKMADTRQSSQPFSYAYHGLLRRTATKQQSPLADAWVRLRQGLLSCGLLARWLSEGSHHTRGWRR